MLTPNNTRLTLALLTLILVGGCASDDEGAVEGSTSASTTEMVGSSDASTSEPVQTESSNASSSTGGPATLEGQFERAGFVVQPGVVTTFTLDDCATLTDCFGNNATTPYVLFGLPPHPDRPDEVPESVVGAIPNIPETVSAAWFLESNEAVVIVGRTPPTASYYGITPYVFTRATDAETRYVPFASVADTLNTVTTQTATGERFDAEFSLVVAGDADVRAAATEALITAGYAEEGMNDLVFSSERVRFGLDTDADQLMLMGRVALIEDPDAAADFLEAPSFEVWRLTFAEESTNPEAAPERTPRGDGTNEDVYRDSLDALEDAIETSLGDAAFESISVASSQTVAFAIDPEQCLTSGNECLGDNTDTTYAVGPLDVATADGTLTLGPDEAFIVYGVNHAATGKATYSNMSLYSQARRAGVIAIADAQMEGSADRFLPDHPDRDALWAYEIRRACDGRPYCAELPTSFPGVPIEENIFFIFRAYLQPGSTVSPGHAEILAERVIKVASGAR
ncbi:MAG: hypothetical protein AAGA54_36490 [Myxococcota bacterium]